MSKQQVQWWRRWLSVGGKWTLPVLVGVGVAGLAERSLAHGVVMQYNTTQAISIQAKYDSGEPFANAQVIVYAPDSDTPWTKGTTDNNGMFTFTPDQSKPGTWQVKVRSAGHGDVANIPVGETTISETQNLAAVSSNAGYTPLQKGVMAAAVIWGCVGTALFFLRRKA